MFTIIYDYCIKCEICDKNRKYSKITSMEIFEMDHCGPFTKTSHHNSYVFSIVNDYTNRNGLYLPVIRQLQQ